MLVIYIVLTLAYIFLCLNSSKKILELPALPMLLPHIKLYMLKAT